MIEQGLVLHNAGQLREAAALFDQVTREFKSSTAPEARSLVWTSPPTDSRAIYGSSLKSRELHMSGRSAAW